MQEEDFRSSGPVVKITVAEQPTVTTTAAAVDTPGAQQVRQETTLQLKYVTGKISSDYITIQNSSLVNLMHLVQTYICVDFLIYSDNI